MHTGDPVVTQLSLVFSALSAMLPHVQLQAWQADALTRAQPQLLGMLLAAGSAAGVAGDIGTSVAATWRASAAMLAVRLFRSDI